VERLAVIAGLGLVLGGAPLVARFRPSFGAALALAALVVLGLSQLVGYLRRESD